MKQRQTWCFWAPWRFCSCFGAVVSVRSRANTSAVAVDAPAAVVLASSSRYQDRASLIMSARDSGIEQLSDRAEPSRNLQRD